MANRFWVGGTGTWNSGSTAFWSTTTGGAGGASVPGTSDVAIFDGSSGGGTVTVDSPNGAGVVTIQALTCGAFTGTLDFSANNNDVTLANMAGGQDGLNASGTGTRTINLGSGTWTITMTVLANLVNLTTTTNLTFSGASADFVINGTTANARTFIGGGQSFGSLTIETNTSRGVVVMGNSSATIGSLSLAAGTSLLFTAATTTTITNGFTLTGTSSLPILVGGQVGSAVAFTLSLGGTCTIDWGIIFNLTKSGAGSLAVTNGLDAGRNTSVTITPPAAGGGGQKVYGG